MKMIQWGMIGCGDVTEVKSAPAFNQVPGSRLVAVMSRTESRVRDYARRHHVPQWTVDARALIQNPEVNAIYVATPPAAHAEYVKMAAAAGKPVYVEKPMACRHAECRDMIAACERARVPLFVAYYRRRQPRFVKIKELLDRGAIGAVRLVDAHLWQAPRAQDQDATHRPWRVQPEIAGGGYFYDVGSHQLDLLDFFLGPIAEVCGSASNQAGWYPAEDVVCGQFRFANGVLGSGSWCFTTDASHQVDRVEMIGSRGTLTWSTFSPAPICLHTSQGTEQFDIPPPATVQLPLIQSIVEELQGRGTCPSTGHSGARTNWVMETMTKRSC